jgi:hypothetical protein
MISLSFCALPPLSVLEGVRVVSARLQYQVTGLLFVFVALGAIWLLMRSLGLVVPRLQRGSGGAAFAEGDELAIEPGVLVAIFAAAAEAIEGDIRIVAITPEFPAGHAEDIFAWSHEGRRQHFESHKVR